MARRYGGSGKYRAQRLATHAATTTLCGGCKLVQPSSQVRWIDGRPLCAECRQRRGIEDGG